MDSVEIRKIGITAVGTDAIVNAANSSLSPGGGVCGAIFSAAGFGKLQAACYEIGRCDVGSAVITPAFDLPAKYIIHAVGPVWFDGASGEPEQLYGAYRRSLELAVENGCRSIGFPLISAGIFGYPPDKAWEQAIAACADFIREKTDSDFHIVFAVIDDGILALGERTLAAVAREKRLAIEDDGRRLRQACGFDAPAIGRVYPKDTIFRKKPDGTVTPIFPDSE